MKQGESHVVSEPRTRCASIGSQIERLLQKQDSAGACDSARRASYGEDYRRLVGWRTRRRVGAQIGAPDQPELAIGAIDEAGEVFLSGYGLDIDPAYLEAEKRAQLKVLQERRARYTPNRGPIDPHDRIVIVVDDGIATGPTMTAALRAVRRQKPTKLVGAVAVASPSAARAMAREADAIVCLSIPADFYAVGQFFEDFSQVTDDEVIAIMQERDSRTLAAG
jgi:predicted phosphoribosyltransferase